MKLELLVQNPYSIFILLLDSPGAKPVVLEDAAGSRRIAETGQYFAVQPDTRYHAWLVENPEIQAVVNTPRAALSLKGAGFSG